MAASVFKKALFPVLLVAVALTAGAVVSRAESAGVMSKGDVEKIISDYIMANPQLIMDSVNQYQQKIVQDRMASALKDNRDQIYSDHGSPFVGNEKGDVSVVEFFDYNCGYCKKAWPELKAVLDSDKNVKVIFKDFPILGPTSETASKWALAAHKQNKYFEFHVALMDHKGRIDDDSLKSLAESVGLDVAKLKTDADSSEIQIQLEKNRALARSLGISGTPAFLIGDEVSPGMVDADSMKKIIAEQRAKKSGADGKKEDKKE